MQARCNSVPRLPLVNFFFFLFGFQYTIEGDKPKSKRKAGVSVFHWCLGARFCFAFAIVVWVVLLIERGSGMGSWWSFFFERTAALQFA
jgi:hypothetical protein